MEIQILNQSVFKPFGILLSNVVPELEGRAYFAHSFQLNGKMVKFRNAKTTPTKTGQSDSYRIVAIWKRNEEGITVPFDISDDIEFLIISTRKGDLFGAFIFPKMVLHQQKIFSDKNKDGKRSTS